MKRRTKPSRTSSLPQLRASLLAATALSVLSSLVAAPAIAQSASWNGTTSSDWFDALNWSGAFPNPTVDVIVNGGTHSPKITGGGSAGGGNLRVGDAATGTLTIENGTLEVYNTAIGKDGGTGTITVDGSSAHFRSSTPISVGGENGTGTLTIRNGGSVSTLQGVIGDGLGSTGTVTVHGPNSSWVTTGAGMVIGNYGEGHFTVSGGGSVNNERAMLGLAPTGRGTLVVTGAGSSWIDSGDMYVGYLGGSGTLEVRAGGAVEIFNTLYVGYGGEGIASVSGVDSILTTHGGVTVGGDRNGTFTVSDRATVNSGGGYIDAASGYQGVATVTGAGSTWIMGDQLIIALEGRGTLTVTDGGRLETTQISLGSRNGANGTLTISDRGVVATNYVMMAEEVGARATLRLESGGRLEAQQVQRYDGAGTVVFDGGILRLTASQFGLFSGFQTGDVTLAAGGGTIDTGTFQVHMDVGLIGSGSLTKLGTGTFHLWGANSYSGTTLISAGTLRARETNVLSAASTHDIASGATLRLDNNKNQVIGGLAGAGSVLLGNAQLTVGANDSSTLFSGVISGTGKLVKSGSGTLTLSGSNDYSGGTEIVAGTLAVSADANLGGASGGLTFNGGTLATTASFDTVRNVSLLQAGTIDVAASTTLGLTGVVSGTGDLRKTGSGTLRLDNTGNGYGNTLVEAGTLIGTASSISGNISNAGTVVFDQATDATFAGTIGGLGGSSGAMVKQGAGDLTLTGTSSLDWSITAGGLTTAAGRFTGNADIGTGASLTFRQNADASYGGQLTGAGRVVKAGFATLTLMGTNSYSGGTELIGGRLSVSADSNLGAASGGLTFNGGTLLATASFDTSRSVSLQHTGVFDVAADTTLGLTGAVSGTGDLQKRGSGTLRLDNVSSSYGNTQVEAGTLIGNARSISGNINNIGTVVFDQANDETFAGTIKGFDGALGMMIKQGAGNLTLTGTSSLNWSIAAGGLITAAERFSGTAKISTGASLTFDQSADASYGGALTGTGNVIKSGIGSLTLTGASTYTGATTIEGGALVVNGAIDSRSGGVAVNSGGTLSGMGTIAGLVTVNAGGTLSGTSGTTLRMGGLTLGSGASVNVALSGPSTTALFNVTGNLTLGGTLNVAGQGDFGAGVYRLIDYSGTFTNNGLAIGSTPNSTSAGDFFVQTAVAGQVNLLNSSGQTLGFWDGSQTVANGTIDGGSGTWSITNTNWTNADGSLNAPYHPNPTYAVFQGTAGTVMVDSSGGTIGVTGLQFVTDGYLVQGGAIALQGAGGSTTVRVGDGTAAGANTIATISSALTGTSTLVKDDRGTLILSGTNSYSGGTTLRAGRLSISADANLGATAGGLTLDGGTLATTASFDTSRGVTLQRTGTFDVAAATTLGLTGAVSGTGDLVKLGTGTLRLDNTGNSYGNTLVQAGMLIGNSGSISGNIGNAGTVVFDQAANGTFAGTISGLGDASGAMVKQGAGNLTLAGTSSLDWSITAGGLTTAAERFSGNADIGTGASLTFDQTANASYGGVLSGTGGFTKTGSGTLTLSGNSSYTGATTITGGALIVTGAIDSRSGGVAVNGGGTLSGTGTITGAVTVNAGGTLAGIAGSTLTMGGLTLGNGASVNVTLGAPSNAALFNVTGNLTLGGTLNVTSQGDFGAGVYRLIDYSGTLTNNGLAIGSTPNGTSAGDFFVQTALAGQVNLLNSSGQTLGFWDGSQTVANGTIDGGSGIWSATNTNWTNANGSLNAPYHPNPTYAVFQGTVGTVTVDGSGGTIGVTGLQFVTDGYRVQGGAIALQGAGGSTTVRVGDGTAAGASTSATVTSALTGTSTLVKDDLGTLILAGNNSYSGGTMLRAGSLSVSADANLGAASGGLIFNGGVLATTGSFDTSRNISLQQAGRFDVATGTTLGLTGRVSGTGDLRKMGSGTLRLDNLGNSYGNTQVQAGMLIGNAQSISGNIGNAGTVMFDQAADGTFAGAISGLDGVSGSMVKRGAGKLTLAGTSTLDWTITAGGLITAAQRFSGNVSIGADASLTFDQRTNASYGGALSGAGGFVKTGAGSLTLTGNSTHAGATTIDGGALVVTGAIDSRSGGVAVNNSATLSGTGTIAGPVTVNAGGTLAGSSGSTLTMGGLTLGSGSSVNVALGGPSSTALFNVIGNLTLDGTLNVTDLGGFGQGIYRLFDYGGALTDNGLTIGTLPGSTVGEVQTSIAKQVNLLVSESGPTPTILFWNGTTTVPTGTVQGGSGSWGGATTNWTNANGTRADAWNGVFAVFQGASGIVTVNAAGVSVTGLQFAVDGYRLTGGAVTLNGADGSTTVRVGDGTATGAGFTAVIDSSLIGDSRLVKNDLGTLVLTGGNSYSGGTTIAAGTLQIGNGGTSGSILGNVTNNGLLRFARSDATTFGGAISGSGGVQVQSGSVTFTATNSYAGPTTIGTGASLQLGTGGAAGTIVGDVANSGTLIVNLSAAFAYAGVLSGNGTVRQIGSGFTSLSGDSSSFTGTTRVENGVLSVNGKLGGTVTVMGGGQLQGSGTVSNVAVAGTIAPGNSIGTLNVGNVTFQAGSIYQVEVNASGQSDRIVATGTATLNGGSVQVLAGQGSYQANTTYTILTAAGGRTGTFAGVTSNLAFLAPSLSYDPDNVYLTLTRNTVSFPSIGGTFNQRQAGAGVESLGQGNPIWNAVVQMDAPTAQAAFNQLSGEVHASAKTALYEDSRLVRDGALSRLRQAFGGSVVAPSTAQVASVDDACSGETCQADPTIGIAAWAQGFGSWGYTSSDGNAAGLSRSTGGVLVGVDAAVFEVARLGLFGGYSHTNFNVADRQSSGGSDNVHLGAYGGAQWGPIGIRAGLVYTWHNLSTSRSVAFPGFADSLRATYGAGTFQVFGEAGYRVEVGQAAFEPFANIAYMSLSTKGFSETGGAAALTSTGLTNNVTATTLGLRAGSAFVIAGLAGQARGTVGWQHAFTDTTPWANLQLAGGTPFTAAGVPIARDAALLELGIDLQLSERASVGLGYTGQFAAGSQDQSVRGNFTFKF